MKKLESAIPPPLVAAICALGMWGVSKISQPVELDQTLQIVFIVVLSLTGLLFAASGMLSFKSAQTTVDPLKPHTASSLVTKGVYRITRNPMYIGLTCLLLAWSAYLSAVWSLAGIAVFIGYIQEFQIKPEEKALHNLFGDEYKNYTLRVRRWL